MIKVNVGIAGLYILVLTFGVELRGIGLMESKEFMLAMEGSRQYDGFK